MGLGHFGGGIAVTRWMAAQGARVTVTDASPREKLAASLTEIKDIPAELNLGGHDPSCLNHCDLLVVSPAVPKDKSEFVVDARRRGIPISSEMNLFIERCPSRTVVGITGSAGKSTTTGMLGAMLDCWGEASGIGTWLGGNIGRSLLSALPQIKPDHIVALELSSFQL